jgi:hypothetical protein
MRRLIALLLALIIVLVLLLGPEVWRVLNFGLWLVALGLMLYAVVAGRVQQRG